MTFTRHYKDQLHMVSTFMKAMGQPVSQGWDTDVEQLKLGYKLIMEEAEELGVALSRLLCARSDTAVRENVVKELTDLMYVCNWLVALIGVDINDAFARVHLSNMSKLGEDGKPVLREDGKVAKGPNYQPPFLAPVVGRVPVTL